MRRVVLVHDYLTQRGGAERVVLAMLEAFPDARVVTSIYTPETTFPEFADHHVETLLPRGIPLLRRDPRLALPMLAPLFSRHTVRDGDVVICSSSGWAHGVRTRVPKIVYCHTPARWLYQPTEYGLGHGQAARLAMRALRRPLRSWDARAAASANVYLANSTTVAERIRNVYGRTAEVLHPPPGITPEGPQKMVRGMTPGFLLTVARGRGYKNTAAVVAAARASGVSLTIVGDPPPSTYDGVTYVPALDDAGLRWLYANCRALVAAAYEDFGLTPVEAMGFGKPVVALQAGGYLDTVVDGVTGVFFDAPGAAAIAKGIARLDSAVLDAEIIRRHSERFARERFASELRRIVSETLDEEGRPARTIGRQVTR